MNPPTALGRRLTGAGITLRLNDGGGLRYTSPQGALTDELRREIAAVKADLVAWLEGEASLCDTCSRRIESARPAGYGGVLIDGRLFHIATCLPQGYVYDAAAGTVVLASDTLLDVPAAPGSVAALSR